MCGTDVDERIMGPGGDLKTITSHCNDKVLIAYGAYCL